MTDHAKMAASVFDKLAALYQEKYMDTSLYHDTFDMFCESIKPSDAHILELACGPGNITSYLLKKRPGWHLLGLDLAPQMIELAGINNPTAEFKVMDCRKIDILQGKYDGVICGFGLPYFTKDEVKDLIRKIADIMVPDGVIYFSTMEDDYEKSALQTSSSGDQVFMHYHEEGYLTAYLDENGFGIISMNRKTYTGPDGKPVIDLIIIAQKQ